MPIIEKPDEWSSVLAKLAEMVFTSNDIYLTMRFSNLYPEEQFPATMAFGNSRLFLYTGINQCRRQAQALQKYQDAGYDLGKMDAKDLRLMPFTDSQITEKRHLGFGIYTSEEVTPASIVDHHFEPREVDEFLNSWRKYKDNKPPYDEENITVILNDLQPWNQSLQWFAMAWEPVQRALYNLRYAVGSRTFKGFIDLGGNMYQRETDVKVGQHSKRRLNPFSKKQEEE